MLFYHVTSWQIVRIRHDYNVVRNFQLNSCVARTIRKYQQIDIAKSSKSHLIIVELFTGTAVVWIFNNSIFQHAVIVRTNMYIFTYNFCKRYQMYESSFQKCLIHCYYTNHEQTRILFAILNRYNVNK